jgi:hypothetical protein
MGFANSFVASILRSPIHRVLSGSTDLVRYTGRRSGRQFTTPTQYVGKDDDLLILVGRPETKTWWRNFLEERDLDVLVQGRWRPMRARAVNGADEPEVIGPLLEVYLRRFPKAARALAGDNLEDRSRRAVLVRCRPR